jgi:hypothetical protein
VLRPAASSYRMACRRREEEEEEETPRQQKAREGEEAASEGVGWLGFLPGWIRGHLSRARPNGSGALPVVAFALVFGELLLRPRRRPRTEGVRTRTRTLRQQRGARGVGPGGQCVGVGGSSGLNTDVKEKKR